MQEDCTCMGVYECALYDIDRTSLYFFKAKFKWDTYIIPIFPQHISVTACIGGSERKNAKDFRLQWAKKFDHGLVVFGGSCSVLVCKKNLFSFGLKQCTLGSFLVMVID